MYLLFYFCLILKCITDISGKNVTPLDPLETSNTKNQNIKSTLESQLKDSIITNVTLNTEGGSVIPKIPSLALPKESHSEDLTKLDKEIGKSKLKSVVPRKGVQYDSAEENPSHLNRTKERIDSTISDSKVFDDKVIAVSPVLAHPAITKSSTKPSSASDEATKDKTNSTSQTTIPAIPKKPLVLSSEAISETDRKNQMEKAKTESSSKSLIADQLISPSVKHEPASHSSHPDMVIPIVLSMLVLPMFAVLGYLALRRGQEAWKNRHYKRMDFLLDGMYND